MTYRNTQSGLSNRLAYIIVILLCILIGVAIYGIKEYKTAKQVLPAPVTQPKPSVITEKKVPIVATTSTENDLYKGITDTGFVTFAHATIDKRCPFYEPNGVAYHECLSDWMSELEKKLLVEQVDEVHAYCEMFSKKYADSISFESSELFTKCSIYKLQP